MNGKHMEFIGKIIQVEVRQITLPNGHQMDMEVIHHPGGSAVVALDDRQQICLLKQYRCVFEEWLWELPAGKRDHQEPPIETAQRELAEEAGILAEQWVDLGPMTSSPGVFSEQVYLYLARQLSSIEPDTAPDEVLQVHWLPLTEAYQWVMSGVITDAKSVIGILKSYQLLKEGGGNRI
ncbi:NUDIX domain-containing protein [Kaarinaea lacus]